MAERRDLGGSRFGAHRPEDALAASAARSTSDALAKVAAAEDERAHDCGCHPDQRAAAGGSLLLGTARVEIALKHDLRGQLVAQRLAFLAGQSPCVDQALLGFNRGVALVEVDDRTRRSREASHAPNSRVRWASSPSRPLVCSGRPTTSPLDVVFEYERRGNGGRPARAPRRS